MSHASGARPKKLNATPLKSCAQIRRLGAPVRTRTAVTASIQLITKKIPAAHISAKNRMRPFSHMSAVVAKLPSASYEKAATTIAKTNAAWLKSVPYHGTLPVISR